MPITFAYEHQATNWLTLRGSIVQNFLGRLSARNYDSLNNVAQSLAISNFGSETGGSSVKIDNTTDVRAGMTLTFGNLSLDGLIGTNGTAGTSSATDNGALDLDRLMTRVAATYKF